MARPQRIMATTRRGIRYNGYKMTIIMPTIGIAGGDKQAEILQIAKELAVIAGGIIRYQVTGGYVDELGVVHQATCWKVELYFNNSDLIDSLFAYVEVIADVVDQAAIIADIAEVRYLVARPKSQTVRPDEEYPNEQ